MERTVAEPVIDEAKSIDEIRDELIKRQRGAGEELAAIAHVIVQDLMSPRAMITELGRATKRVEQVLWERMGSESAQPPDTESS